MSNQKYTLIKRRSTKSISVGNVSVGGNAPISIQSMTKTDTRNAPATIDQIQELAAAGCQIIRLAVPDEKAARQLAQIKAAISLPLIADIHFDYRLALIACESGVDGLRLNPGNIGATERIRAVVSCAKQAKIPIRIGVNSGSLEKDLLEKYGYPSPQALVESALRHIRILERENFDLIKVSLKASDVLTCVEAYRLLAQTVDYPLHLGITEAGTAFSGTIKSSVGLGILLAEGIGDTLRVSLTAPPLEEVRAGIEILKSLHLREGIEFISCPTCGRCQIDLTPIAQRVERELAQIQAPLKVAVMGCAVNGPGEARQADAGIAGGKGEGLLFKHGQIMGKVPQDKLAEVLIATVKEMTGK
ncbi:MAG: flavodoxin-dependent (E)-4-hydroxy-3-methylbut-2-enyl-diphosphate synthase [Candidatus Schekmanbacteria bacterium]|nr:flavodoxin-dependent (E)-4-hydroxy-3-methylbut-2-enyl-diphosphate synthase [Candidatus Schekmanbacteria bacterium]